MGNATKNCEMSIKDSDMDTLIFVYADPSIQSQPELAARVLDLAQRIDVAFHHPINQEEVFPL